MVSKADAFRVQLELVQRLCPERLGSARTSDLVKRFDRAVEEVQSEERASFVSALAYAHQIEVPESAGIMQVVRLAVRKARAEERKAVADGLIGGAQEQERCGEALGEPAKTIAFIRSGAIREAAAAVRPSGTGAADPQGETP